jgi:hypothetical protein
MQAAPAEDRLDRLSRRRTLAALIFIVCSLLSSARILRDARTPALVKRTGIDIPQQSDQRFAEVKASLPERGVIGYLGERGALARGDYYLAEYALAPLVVDDSPNHPLVLGNFPDSPLPAPANLRLMKDFGNGVALFAVAYLPNVYPPNKDAN